jgi:lysophospholipase L1-like esterase
MQKELGGEYEVITEALNGRTTDISDNQLAGAGLDGSAYLPAAIASHHPLDLVIIMLGGNDLKAAYNRTPYRIALGAGHLIDICNTIGGGIGTPYKSPKVLLICPPPLSPKINEGPFFPRCLKVAWKKRMNSQSSTQLEKMAVIEAIFRSAKSEKREEPLV